MITAAIITAVVSIAVIGNRLAYSQARPARILAGVTLAALSVALGLVATSCLSAPYSPWDAVRVAAPMAAVRGFPLYSGQDSGAVLSTMYGPIGMLAFAPAALLRDPATAAIVGRFLAALFTFSPLGAACLMAGKSASRWWRLAVFVTAAFALLSLPSLRYSALYLHADAPALGLMGIACILVGSTRPGWNLIAAIACVLAVATKQTLFLLPLALVGVMAATHGRRKAAIWGVSVGIAFAIGAAGLAATTHFGDVYLNVVSIPAGVPWKGRAPWNLLGFLGELALHATPLLLVSAVFLRPGRLKHAAPLPTNELACSAVPPQRNHLAQTFALVSLAMVPLAILGRVKQAGDVNSFSPVLYPLLLALTALAVSTEPLPASRSRLAMTSLLLLGLVFGTVRLSDEANLLVKLRPLDAESRYLRLHPGEIYLPWHPAAHLAVEGRATHHLFTAWERGEAGFPVSKAHLLSAMPPNCRFVAFPLKRLGPVAGFGSSIQMLERHGMRVDRDHPVRLAGLPDYECFAITR